MKKIKITNNSKVTLISPSSGIAGEDAFKGKYNIGKTQVRKIWNNVNEATNSLSGIKSLNDSPQLRANDFNESFNDGSNLLISNIGGADSITYVDKINFSKNDLTTFMGFSDSTSIHLAFYANGVQTYYGPSTLDGFAENGGLFEYDVDYLKWLMRNDEIEVVSSKYWTSEYLEWTNRNLDNQKRKRIKEKIGFIFSGTGVVTGKLLGGNIDTLVKIMNHNIWPPIEQWKDKILFLETSEQKVSPQVFEEYIKLLKNEIEASSALIFGKPKDEKYFDEYLEIIKKLNKPYVYNMNFGHTSPKMIIPYGGEMTIDFETKKMLMKK